MKKILQLLALVLIICNSCEQEENMFITNVSDEITVDYLLNGDLEYVINGEQVFREKGKPGVISIPIGSIDLNEYEDCFILYISNGEESVGTVSSAIIALDDQELLNTSDFSSSAVLYDFEICGLTTQTVLDIEVRGEPGTYIEIWMEGKKTTKAPVAYYPFNGNANDESGNGNHGTVNGAVLTTDRFGHENAAYFFDGINDNITLGDKFDENQELTLSVWVRFSSELTNDKYYGIIEKHDMDSNSKKSFTLVKSGNSKWVQSFFSRFYNGETGGTDCNDANIPISNKWYFVVSTFENGVSKLFIDGLEVSSTTSSLLLNNSITPTTIGNNYSNDHPFHGVIDDVRVYDIAITSEDINYLYNENGWGQ